MEHEPELDTLRAVPGASSALATRVGDMRVKLPFSHGLFVTLRHPGRVAARRADPRRAQRRWPIPPAG